LILQLFRSEEHAVQERLQCQTLGVTEQGADPRYSLANERTFLAWIRTSLGLLAAAAALVAIDVPWPSVAVHGIAVLLASAAAFAAFLAWDRWRRVEAAIADGRPAPAPRAHVILSLTVVLVAAVVVVLILS
jgi:putative membrane protein